MLNYSSLRDTTRRPLSESLPLAFPWSIHIEPTNRCNFSCRFCPESFSDYETVAGGYGNMDFATFSKICDQIKEGGGVKVLRFYMLGEPLLNKSTPKFIAHAKQQGIADRLELTTNGSPLNAARLQDELIASGLDYLRVSIYGIDPTRHRERTQSKLDPQEIHASVASFYRRRNQLGRGPFIYAKLLDGLDPDENSKFLDLYRPITDEACIESPMNWDGQRELIQEINPSVEYDASKLYPFSKIACSFPFYTAVINVNGDVTFCCVDWSKLTKVGNIHEQTLKEIWLGEAANAFRCLHLKGLRGNNTACRDCTFLYTAPDNVDDAVDRFECP